MNEQQLRQKYSGEADSLDEIIRIKNEMVLIEKWTSISRAHLLKVFFTNPHRLKNGLDFDALYADVVEYLQTHSDPLTNRNVNQRGQIILSTGEVWSAVQAKKTRRDNQGSSTFRISTGRRH